MSKEHAARVFAPICHLDPDGIATGESVAAGGVPMRYSIEGGSVIVVLDVRGDALWIEGAAGGGSVDMTRRCLDWVEETARQLGCARVAFQTTRRGLMRKARALGYTVNGWQVSKAI